MAPLILIDGSTPSLGGPRVGRPQSATANGAEQCQWRAQVAAIAHILNGVRAQPGMAVPSSTTVLDAMSASRRPESNARATAWLRLPGACFAEVVTWLPPR